MNFSVNQRDKKRKPLKGYGIQFQQILWKYIV